MSGGFSITRVLLVLDGLDLYFVSDRGTSQDRSVGCLWNVFELLGIFACLTPMVHVVMHCKFWTHMLNCLFDSLVTAAGV